MGLLFKVRPKRCDSQCLVQTSQETRDSKERKNAKIPQFPIPEIKNPNQISKLFATFPTRQNGTKEVSEMSGEMSMGRGPWLESWIMWPFETE